jgi:hypothetical protein
MKPIVNPSKRKTHHIGFRCICGAVYTKLSSMWYIRGAVPGSIAQLMMKLERKAENGRQEEI